MWSLCASIYLIGASKKGLKSQFYEIFKSKRNYFISTGSFPLSSRNQLTPTQRQALLPVMESVLRVMESDKPSVNDVNTLMVQVRDLLKKVPEGYLPNLKQFGFDTDSI